MKCGLRTNWRVRAGWSGRWVGFSIFFVGWLLWLPGAPAAEFIGAEKLLTAVNQMLNFNADAQNGPTNDNARPRLEKEVKAFAERQVGLPPETAAMEWLSLFDRFWSLPTVRPGSDEYYSDMVGDEGFSIQSVIKALPGPGAWPVLGELVKKRPVGDGKNAELREAGLRILAFFLNGDRERAQKEVARQIVQLNGWDPSEAQNLIEMAQRLQMQIDRLMPGGSGAKGPAANFEKALEFYKKSPGWEGTLKVPDLVTVAGNEKAEQLLRRVLDIPGALLNVPVGKETRKLAQKIALEKIGQLSKPQWELVCSPDAVELFEALQKKFPAQKKTGGNQAFAEFVSESSSGYRSFGQDTMSAGERQAQCYYILGLLVRDRVADAVMVTTNWDLPGLESYQISSVFRLADYLVPAPVLFGFYEQVLRGNPDLPLWDEYVALAPVVGKTNEMFQMLNQMAVRTNLNFMQRLTINEQLVKACLAVDRVEEGVALLRTILTASAAQETTRGQQEYEQKKAQFLLQLASLGRLMHRPEWVNEGLQGAQENLLKSLKQKGETRSYYSSYSLNGICKAMLENGRFSEAEALVKEVMAANAKNRLQQNDRSPWERGQALSGELMQLAEIYNKAGRHADVLTLLEKAPWWGARDLLDIPDNDSTGESLSCVAAEALHAAKRDAEAVAILKHYLYVHPQDDRAYRDLCDIVGYALIPWLDEIYRGDRFEERPLIWKAVLLSQSNQLFEAERTVREALKVDPTDGEQKKGDRVRGYAVLGDILLAEGKTNDAVFFHRVVESVRIAEEGDELTSAGLITRSLALYEKAQGYFYDAYCIQWRLAERLRALGNYAAAEEHYRVVFERMPEQFGRVASLCFGCEGVFRSAQSRSVAENVLLRLATNATPRPQVFYLLGELRQAQENHPDAYKYYRRAIELDPDYLDVWNKIAELSDELFLPQTERDAMVLKMLALDPLQRHFQKNLGEVGDLKGVWELLEKSRKLAIPEPESLLVLTASKAEIEKEMEKAKGSRDRYADASWRMGRYYGRGKTTTPGEMLAGHEVVSVILQLMAYGAR